jgi:hypothetical protein
MKPHRTLFIVSIILHTACNAAESPVRNPLQKTP